MSVTANILQRTFRIGYRGSAGTCFTIDVGGKRYLITAKHVVDGIQDDETVDISHNKDWLPVRVRLVGHGAGDVDVTVLAPQMMFGAAHSLKHSTAGVVLGEDIYFLGFPYGLSMEVKTDLNAGFPLPLVKKAAVSALGLEDGPILLDGHNNVGFSGGPVARREPGKSKPSSGWCQDIATTGTRCLTNTATKPRTLTTRTRGSSSRMTSGTPWRSSRKIQLGSTLARTTSLDIIFIKTQFFIRFHAKIRHGIRHPLTLARESRVVLSMAEKGRKEIGRKEIIDMLDVSPQAADHVIRSLRRKGWLERASWGRYLLIPPEMGPDALGESNLLALASQIAEPYYFGYATAAAHYGFTTQHRQVIRLVTPVRTRNRRVLDTEVHIVNPVPRKFFGFGEIDVLGHTVMMSDRERPSSTASTVQTSPAAKGRQRPSWRQLAAASTGTRRPGI